MIFLSSLCCILVLVSSDVPPLPPLNPEVDDNLLQWTPADQDGSITHTVQYKLWRENKWRIVPSCVQTSVNSCNVISTMHEEEDGCVKLRVQAVRNGFASEAVEACSAQGGRCSPQVRVSSRPGSLTVHLSRDQELVHEYADHAQYQLCYLKQGESRPSCRKSLSSVTLSKLEEGQTYCVQVQFLLYSKPVGLPRCFQCQEIPIYRSKHFWIILVVVFAILAVTVGSIMAYLIIFHRKKVKGWLWLRPEPTPECLTDSLHDAPVSSPVEEKCSTITAFFSSEEDD